MTGIPSAGHEPITTDGTIAVANLHAQISGMTAWSRQTDTGPGTRLSVATQTVLIDLLTLRGEVLGRIADYERASQLAEQLVREAPDNGRAWLARAKTRAIFHRFTDALSDLETAARNGVDRAAVDAERAPILQAAGCYWHALVLCGNAVKRQPGFTTLGALAVLQAERGEVAAAERLFAEARGCYQDVSPFPIASLDYRRGLMWLGEGDLPAARSAFRAAHRRVPAYAPVLRELAEADAALGDSEAAIGALRPLAASSDDPQYAASLARILRGAGHRREARRWHDRAAARYAELVQRYPEAFDHHAGDFWDDAAEPSARLADAS